ncbi:MAG: TIGR00730 family Rossman fold protein, partial [Candidatus Sungbacteria bacterium]|nr:TIGR00730 family Rossman fold protein [Candidatus Sungbacteria bacterium]
MAELIEGWQFLADFKKTITFFGSARIKKGNKWYDEAEKLGRLLAKSGYNIITGSGYGIMEAANRGAFNARKEVSTEGSLPVGHSVGLHIQLPNEQQKNKFVSKSRDFNYFFVRKVMLSYHSSAY